MIRRPLAAIPPPPRRREWLAAGVCAGLLLAVAETIGLRASDARGAPSLIFAIGLASAGAVAVPASVLGLVLARWRVRHSAMVGAILAPLLAAPVLADPLALASRPAQALGALVLAAGVGALAGRSGARSEKLRARPWPALPLWAVTAGLLAASERFLAGARSPRRALGACLLTAAAAGALLAFSRRRWMRGEASWRLAAGELLLLAALAWGPHAVPWLLVEAPHGLAPASGYPLNLLLVALPPTPPELARASLLGWGSDRGILIPRLRIEPAVAAGPKRSAPDTWLLLADGRPLFAPLAGHGYRTAAVLGESRSSTPRGTEEVRRELGRAPLLAREAPSIVGADLLLALRRVLPRALGLDEATARPGEIAGEALRWLLRWRAGGSSRPFALWVDLGVELPLGDAPRILLDGLAQLGLAEATLVVLAAPLASGPTASAPARELALYLEPPAGLSAGMPSAASRFGSTSQLGGWLLRACLAPPRAEAGAVGATP